LTRWERDWAATNLAAKTVERYQQLIRYQIVPRIGQMPVQKLKPAHLQELYGTLLKSGAVDGGPLAQRTVGHVHRLLRRAYGHAVTWGIVSTNPVAAVSPPRVPDTEIEIVGDDDIRRVLKNLRSRDQQLHMIAFLALATGMRRGELLALRWSDIEDDRVRVERSLEQTRGGLKFKAPKTKRSRRSVTIPAEVATELRAYKITQQEFRLSLGIGRLSPVDLLFSHVDGSPRKPNDLSRDWLVATAVVGRPINLHALRHTHVSHLIAAGVDILTISRRVGHAKPTTTLNVYGHLIPNSDDRATQAVANMFARVSGGNPVVTER
jgi:integrase